MDDPGRHRLRRSGMPGVTGLRTFRLLLPVVALFVFAAACDRTIPLGLPPQPCENRITVEPAGSVVISVGESRRLYVRFDLRNREHYSHCSRILPGSRVPFESFRWGIRDSSVARVDRFEDHSGGGVTVTGLTVGRTSIVMWPAGNEHLRRWIPLEVEELAKSEVGQVLRSSVMSRPETRCGFVTEAVHMSPRDPRRRSSSRRRPGPTVLCPG